LSFVPEGDDETMVGRPDTDSYAVLPAEGAALLERMAGGMPPAAAAAWYEQTYGQPVDMPDFLATLDELGFVRHTGEAAAGPAASGGLRRLGRAVFSPPAFGCYLAVICCWSVLVSRHPELAPRPHQIFFTDSLLAVQLLIMFGQIPWLFLHE